MIAPGDHIPVDHSSWGADNLQITPDICEGVRRLRSHLIALARQRTWCALPDVHALMTHTDADISGHVIEALAEDCARRGEPCLAVQITSYFGKRMDSPAHDGCTERERVYAYWPAPPLR
jgi:hypothetical protein